MKKKSRCFIALLGILILLFGMARTVYADKLPPGFVITKDGSESFDDREDVQRQYQEQVRDSELLTWKSGLGSADELDGNIVIVSIFLDDGETYWNFAKRSDQKARRDSLRYLEIATDWIREQGTAWGKEPVFYYDWQEDPDLYYEAEVSTDCASDDEDASEEMADIIDQFIDSEGLKERYQADSILYIAYVNTPNWNEAPSYTLPYDDEAEMEYEIVYLLMGCDGEKENPATYAHEILHTFGAPDLYDATAPWYNYNISTDFVEYCEEYHPNEIMMTTYDVDTYESYYDHISNELTEITAYYIGWTDTSKEAEEFHLQPSQFVLSKSY